MATSWSATAGDAALTTLLSTYTWVQLHIGNPGAAGTSNPAVETTRHQVTWAAVSGGASSNSADVSWTNVAATEDYTFITVWSAASAGTFGMSGTVTANAVTAGDTFTFSTGALTISLTLAS